MSLEFKDKVFCFTGGMAELKRTEAERATRSRGALTGKTINRDLDYLVIGSIPATGWKHGSYGKKIETALELKKESRSKLKIVSEAEFMEALASTPETGTGEIDNKFIVIKYKFIKNLSDFDSESLIDYLELLSNKDRCYVRLFKEYYSLYHNVFGSENSESYDEDTLIITIRIVKLFDLEENPQSFVDDVAIGFEGIDGVDGDLTWFERKEGSSSYVRLLKEVNQNFRNEISK